VVIGRWQVDLAAQRVIRADAAAARSDSAETVRLTRTEWAILELLLQRPGQPGMGYRYQPDIRPMHEGLAVAGSS
jgi:DNA-binding response OmpR family regulator